MSTKRDEAFGLFSQGKTPSEVSILGLSEASVKRYYRLWKQLKPEVIEKAPVLSTVGSIAKGAAFEWKGLLFIMEGKEKESVVGSSSGRRRSFAPDTPVKPR